MLFVVDVGSIWLSLVERSRSEGFQPTNESSQARPSQGLAQV